MIVYYAMLYNIVSYLTTGVCEIVTHPAARRCRTPTLRPNSLAPKWVDLNG